MVIVYIRRKHMIKNKHLRLEYTMMTRQVLAFLFALALAGAPLSWAQGLPVTTPESVGMSTGRLKRINETMKRYIDDGKIAGVVTLVARDGRVAHLEAFGRTNLDKNVPMQKDSIFRIASMSKALTSVAVMMLEEEGKLLISDPVSRYIPAFKSTS